MTASSTQRCRELDAVRGLAAMAVLLFHYTVRYPEKFGDLSAPFRLNLGHFGVEVFFGVSGFVILMTLERCRWAGDFLFARGLRLFPAYWVAVTATFVTLTLFPLPQPAPTWPQALVNLTMTQEFFGVPHVDGVYWSLEVELVFYAWMVALLTLGWLRHPRRLLVLWLLASMATYAWTMASHRAPPVLATRLLLVEHSAYFAIGAAAFVDFRGERVCARTWLVFALAVAQAAFSDGRQGVFLALAMEALFALLVWRKATFLDTPILVFLGTVSYPLYLLHQNIGYLVIAHLRAHQVGHGWAMLAAATVALAAATLLAFGIEQPLQRRVKAWRANRLASRGAKVQALA